MINIYADESCHNAHRYLVIGGTCVSAKDAKDIEDQFKSVRTKHNTWGEVKWEKISKAKLQFYREYVDIFFRLNSSDDLNFHALCVDTRQFDRKLSTPESGFNKLIYQLLLHKFGRKYGAENKLYVHLDKRSTSDNPDYIRPMLNAALRRYHKIPNNPFKRITFIESNRSELIQANDLIIGAIGSRKNGHHLVAGAAGHKVEMGEYISECAKKITSPFSPESFLARRFTIWNFKYKKRS